MMHVQERRAWFVLWFTLVPLGLYWAAVPFVGFMHGAEGLFGLVGLTGFAGLIGRKERREGKVDIDERDREIERAAMFGTLCVFWVLFVFACVVPAFVLGFDAKIPVLVLSNGVFVAMAVVFGVQSLITVILYRRGRAGAEEGGEDGKAA